MDATVPLLDTLGEKHGFGLETTRYNWGAEHYFEHETLIPEEEPDQLLDKDAILHGATGHPDVLNHVEMKPDGHHKIRYELDLFVDIRPAYLFEGSTAPRRIPRSGHRHQVVPGEQRRVYANIGGDSTDLGQTEVAVQSGSSRGKESNASSG